MTIRIGHVTYAQVYQFEAYLFYLGLRMHLISIELGSRKRENVFPHRESNPGRRRERPES